MEECCAVCAEPLEWLAYGPCGHREVCSTCTSRLRFILNDKNCCICKQECPSVVITKALGDYTNAVGDFSTLPAPANEGKVGNYWYYLDTQAYFDDEQHYKMIKAMCRLSCSVCDNTCGAQEPRKELPKRDREFKHIDQLRKHLFHAHKLSMCTLCLEGRKVFICEQKLYTRSQLDRHLSRGDSEVDGSEIERGGFMGHPICDFCRKRFYGDNELYMHMSRDHYTCHICQRRHPEHFEYYQNYSDLEAHFSQEHFLCENDDCMAKKFVVFASEAELKRHNAIEHAGNMSRSQRNAALQIPVSFQYRRSGSERESQRVARGQGRNMNSRLSSANPASSEMLDIQNAIHESMLTATAEDFNSGQSSDPLPSLLSSDMVANSSTSNVSTDPPRYLTAVSRRALNSPLEESAFPPLPGASETAPPRYPTAVSRRALNSPLEESSFPPLPVASGNASHKSRNKGKRSVKSMAALVRGGQGNIRVLNAAESRQNLGPGQLSSLYPVNSSSNQTNGSRNMNYSSRPTVAAVLRGGQGKGRKLPEAHEAGIKKNSQLAVNQIINQTGGISSRSGSVDNHRKGKTVDVGSSKDVTSSSNADSGRSLGKPLEEVEVLSKDGYRTAPPRYPTAVSRRAFNSPLEESAFPSLPLASRNASHKSRNKGKRSVKSMSALVRGGEGNIRILNAAESRQNLGPGQLSSLYPVNSSSNQTNGSRNMNYSSRPAVVNAQEPVPSPDEFPPMAAVVRGGQGNTRVLNAAESRNSFGQGQLSSLYAVNSSSNLTNGYRNMNYSSRPTVVNAQEPVLNANEFPPILGRHHVSAASATENQGQASNAPLLSIEEVRAANKELIESIQSGLGGNEQQFAAFKDVSARFRNGDIGARKYYSHISKLGLSHLVPRLARLCPDQDKGRKLLEAHEAGIKKNSQLAVNQIINQTGGISIGSGSIDNHRKGKTVDVGSSKDVTSRSNADSGRSLGKPSEEVEVLSKDGYRTAKGKAKPRETPVLNGMSGTSGSSSEEPADHCQRPPPLSDSLNAYHGEKWTCNACSLLNKQDSLLCLVCGTERPDDRFMKEPSYGRKGKQKKKASKAQRGNLDDSLASTESNQSSSGSSVWGNGGGQRLVSIAQR